MQLPGSRGKQGADYEFRILLISNSFDRAEAGDRSAINVAPRDRWQFSNRQNRHFRETNRFHVLSRQDSRATAMESKRDSNHHEIKRQQTKETLHRRKGNSVADTTYTARPMLLPRPRHDTLQPLTVCSIDRTTPSSDSCCCFVSGDEFRRANRE